MFYRINICFVILYCVFNIKYVNSDCRQSFMTICDDFEDIKKHHKDAEFWTELIIGSETEDSNLKPVHLMKIGLETMPQLRSLIVIKKISDLESTYGLKCYFRSDMQLQYISFYGNKMRVIKEYDFPELGLKKMSLVNNNIEEIKAYSFTYSEFETFDLSDNKLEAIESKSLPTVTSLKELHLKNNKLLHIEPGSFSSSLQRIFLQNNKLRVIQDGVFDNLDKLEELNLRKNKLKKMINLTSVNELQILDLSFNEISVIPQNTFEKFSKLEVLDLTQNQLTTIEFLIPLVTKKSPEMRISIALNRLEQGDVFKNISIAENHTFFLFGNPLTCTNFEELKEILRKNQDSCDLKFLSSGKTPVCLTSTVPSKKRIDQDILQGLVRDQIDKVDCKLYPLNYLFYYPMLTGCVV